MQEMPSSTLRDATRGSGKVWAFCLNCGHGERLDAWQLARSVRRNMTMTEVARRLRCARCSHRQALVVADPAPPPLREPR
jgi:hypothetical protein